MRKSRTKRKPIHPGEILREEFMADYGLSVSDLATAIGVSRQSVNELVREKRSLSTEMALRLAACFGNSPEQWLNMQRALDLWQAECLLANRNVSIKPIAV
ncbi:MAG: HigA family addiction module antidote protein [Clostridiales Family XIII bacterium]|nr:HigA family addiction module antidote protein [Clostridiales Family XIII bacterium]